jgi:hypothetical protein
MSIKSQRMLTQSQNIIETLILNKIPTISRRILDSELVNDIINDLPNSFENKALIIENKTFSDREVKLFFNLVELRFYKDEHVLEEFVYPILDELTFLTAVRLYNYLGCTSIKDMMEFICNRYNFHNEPRYHKFICHKELNIHNIYTINGLKQGDYNALIYMGYNPKEIIPCIGENEILPLDITTINDSFNEKFNTYKDIIDIVNETENCFIAGGFLIHCIQDMIINKDLIIREYPTEKFIQLDCPDISNNKKIDDTVCYQNKITEIEESICCENINSDILTTEFAHGKGNIEKTASQSSESNIRRPVRPPWRPRKNLTDIDNKCFLDKDVSKPIKTQNLQSEVSGSNNTHILKYLKTSMKKKENSEELNGEVYDIDIFCLRTPEDNINHHANVATEIVKKFQNKFDCRCFTNSAVTTIFIRGSSIQIQIIGCGETNIKDVLASFDLSCSRIAYIKGSLFASQTFHELLYNNWCLKATGTIKHHRIKKYERKGFVINTDNAKIIGDEICDEYEINKWYCWKNEDDKRLLYIVKLLFNGGYEYTTLPLPAVTINWKSTYDSDINSNSDIEPKVYIRDLENCKSIIHMPPLKLIKIDDVEILLSKSKHYDDNFNGLRFADDQSNKIKDVWNSLMKIYDKNMIIWLLNEQKNIKIKDIRIKRSHFLKTNDLINNSRAGKYLLDYKIHRCNITLEPMASIMKNNSHVSINMRVVKLELLD